MKFNYKKQFIIVLLFMFAVKLTFGRRGGGGIRSSGSRSRGSSGGGGIGRFFGGSKSTSHSTSHTGTSSSYPKQTYSPGTGSTNYGWRTNTGGNAGHYYNSPSSTTNWGSSHNSPSYHSPSPQNTFGSFQPVSSGIAPSYHFHRSTSYVPIYIPSSHTYVHHRHYTNNDQSTSSTSNTPPPPPSEPIVYKDSGDGDNVNPSMVVGFNNMILYGVCEKDKHFVITISEDLDEDMDDIPEEFLTTEKSSLFEIVTLKPTTTTTTTTTTTSEPFTTNEPFTREFTTSADNDEWWPTDWNATLKRLQILTSSEKYTIETNVFKSHDNDGKRSFGSNAADDLLDLNFGDMIP